MKIAYRDLKPENILGNISKHIQCNFLNIKYFLVTGEGYCKIADFGLSKSI